MCSPLYFHYFAQVRCFLKYHRCKKNVEIKIKNVKKRKKRAKNKKTFVNVE